MSTSASLSSSSSNTLTPQSFYLDISNYTNVDYSEHTSRMREISVNNPQKYSAARSSILKAFAKKIQQQTYDMFYIFLSTGRDSVTGESYLKILGNNVDPGYSLQESSVFARDAALASMDVALRAVNIILPVDKDAATRVFVGSNVDASTTTA